MSCRTPSDDGCDGATCSRARPRRHRNGHRAGLPPRVLDAVAQLRKIAAALADGIEVDRFFVADRGGGVIGAVACTDRTGRAIRIRAEDWRRPLGLVRGTLAARILAPPFTSRLDYPAETGYIEFAAVAEKVRRQGIATKLVEGVIGQTAYTEYVLEVTDVNTAARDCYRKIGFVDINSEKERFGWLKGFGARIHMRYPR